MKKLTRHNTFEALKMEEPLLKTTGSTHSRLMADFQDFLTQLHAEFSIKKKAEGKYAKKSDEQHS